MDSERRRKLTDRVVGAAEAALAAQGFVAAIDVLGGLGWIDWGTVRRWRTGQIECLESAIQTSPARLSEAMELFRSWAVAKGLVASEVDYVARTPQRPPLQFSRSGDVALERLYRTHWVSPGLTESKRERLAEKASRPPELVVIQPLNRAWTCHRCGATGDLLLMEKPGPACLRCVGLDDLEFLPTGDALLTRRAKAASPRFAVVVRFSKSRGRYERQGLLVEPQALADARRQLQEQRRG
jgi:hypothetical protein